MKPQQAFSKTAWIAEAATAILICIFIYAALSKLLEYRLFVLQLHQHPYLRHIAPTVAWLLPLSELLVAAAMTIPATRKAGLFSAAVMLAGFTVYLGAMLLSGRHLPCACGGIISSLNWSQHMVFNGILIAMAIAAIAAKGKSFKGRIGMPPEKNIFDL